MWLLVPVALLMLAALEVVVFQSDDDPVPAPARTSPRSGDTRR